jgi:hypothetical protein
MSSMEIITSEDCQHATSVNMGTDNQSVLTASRHSSAELCIQTRDAWYSMNEESLPNRVLTVAPCRDLYQNQPLSLYFQSF